MPVVVVVVVVVALSVVIVAAVQFSSLQITSKECPKLETTMKVTT